MHYIYDMKKKKQLYAGTYISVREFVNSGKLLNNNQQPVTETYVYRLIRKYQEGKRDNLPFEYIRLGQIIRIKQ